MIRSALLFCSLALLAGVGIPNPAGAREPESEQVQDGEELREAQPVEGREEWREILLAANQEVALAEKRSAAALQAYKTMRHRRRPRGEAKQAIMDELALSKEVLAAAREDLEQLERAARRAGAAPSWLKFDPEEINAATQTPASQQP